MDRGTCTISLDEYDRLRNNERDLDLRWAEIQKYEEKLKDTSDRAVFVMRSPFGPLEFSHFEGKDQVMDKMQYKINEANKALSMVRDTIANTGFFGRLWYLFTGSLPESKE